MAYCITATADDGSTVLLGALGAKEAYSVGRLAIERGYDLVDVCRSRPDDEAVSADDILGSWLWCSWYWNHGIVNRGE